VVADLTRDDVPISLKNLRDDQERSETAGPDLRRYVDVEVLRAGKIGSERPQGELVKARHLCGGCVVQARRGAVALRTRCRWVGEAEREHHERARPQRPGEYFAA